MEYISYDPLNKVIASFFSLIGEIIAQNPYVGSLLVLLSLGMILFFAYKLIKRRNHHGKQEQILENLGTQMNRVEDKVDAGRDEMKEIHKTVIVHLAKQEAYIGKIDEALTGIRASQEVTSRAADGIDQNLGLLTSLYKELNQKM